MAFGIWDLAYGRKLNKKQKRKKKNVDKSKQTKLISYIFAIKKALIDLSGCMSGFLSVFNE